MQHITITQLDRWEDLLGFSLRNATSGSDEYLTRLTEQVIEAMEQAELDGEPNIVDYDEAFQYLVALAESRR